MSAPTGGVPPLLFLRALPCQPPLQPAPAEVGALAIEGDPMAQEKRPYFEVLLHFRAVNGSQITYVTGNLDSYALTAIVNRVNARDDREAIAMEIRKALEYADVVFPDDKWPDNEIQDKNGFQCGAPRASWYAISAPTKASPDEVDLRKILPYIFSCVGKSKEELDEMKTKGTEPTRVLPYNFSDQDSMFLAEDGKQPLESVGATHFQLEGQDFEYRIYSYKAGTEANGWEQQLTLRAYRGLSPKKEEEEQKLEGDAAMAGAEAEAAAAAASPAVSLDDDGL